MDGEELDYKIEIWNQGGGIDRVLGRLSDLIMARAAFEAGVQQYPKAALSLRLGAQVIREYPKKERQMYVVFEEDMEEHVTGDDRVPTLEDAFRRVMDKCGYRYRFTNVDGRAKLVVTRIKAPERSPEPISVVEPDPAKARETLMLQAVDGRFQQLHAVPADEFECLMAALLISRQNRRSPGTLLFRCRRNVSSARLKAD